MAIATALFVVGIADFFATNTAFPVLVIAGQYVEAVDEAQRMAALGAGWAMFALFNENAFLVSSVMVSAAWAMMAAVMIRSPMFGRATGIVGILAGVTGILAVLEHVSAAPGACHRPILRRDRAALRPARPRGAASPPGSCRRTRWLNATARWPAGLGGSRARSELRSRQASQPAQLAMVARPGPSSRTGTPSASATVGWASDPDELDSRWSSR